MGREWPPEEYIKLGTSGIYLWRIPPKGGDEVTQ
jgi:hypothetical protein